MSVHSNYLEGSRNKKSSILHVVTGRYERQLRHYLRPLAFRFSTENLSGISVVYVLLDTVGM